MLRLDLVYEPPPAFFFVVYVDRYVTDTSFQEVTGLQVETETEDVVEGGQNRYVHRLPVRTKYSNLVLKRGVVTIPSPFGSWLDKAMSLGPVRKVSAKTVVVQLLDPTWIPLVSWKVFGAYPLRWEHSALNAMGNEVLTETVELGYQFFERRAGPLAWL
jgi:phage tail-like protein